MVVCCGWAIGDWFGLVACHIVFFSSSVIVGGGGQSYCDPIGQWCAHAFAAVGLCIELWFGLDMAVALGTCLVE